VKILSDKYRFREVLFGAFLLPCLVAVFVGLRFFARIPDTASAITAIPLGAAAALVLAWMVYLLGYGAILILDKLFGSGR
jgi:hypothetical protein